MYVASSVTSRLPHTVSHTQAHTEQQSTSNKSLVLGKKVYIIIQISNPGYSGSLAWSQKGLN